MDSVHVGHAAARTGWSARMLRYLERAGLVVPSRTPAGYRLYGLRELNQLRSLAELRSRFGLGIGDIAFAARLRRGARAPPPARGGRRAGRGEVAAALVAEYDVSVFAIKGEDNDTYYAHIEAAVDHKPHFTMDDGADVIGVLHSARREQLGEIIAGTEETTTGVIRLKALEEEGKLGFPIIAVNEALTKHMFDNRYGTGQSTIDGIIRATNVLIAGKRFVVCGYGWVGRGVASRARGMGAHVIITEVDPLKALEASMDGFEVLPLAAAAKIGDIFCTATGDKHVIARDHMERMKDGALLANTGHFNVEIEIPALREMAVETRRAREFVEEFTLADGRRLYLVADGRLVNLSAAEGHPALVMDMSFANQALALEYATQHASELDRKVYPVPAEIDNEIARLKLETMGVEIDTLTEEQAHYLASWDEGT